MKIGDIDIKKAYLGSLELTNKNAFIGEVPVIEGGSGWQGLKLKAMVNNVKMYIQCSASSGSGYWTYIQYSKDNGATWTAIPRSSDTALLIEQGEEVLLKGPKSTSMSKSYPNMFRFVRAASSGSCTIKLSGKIVSLLDNGACGDLMPTSQIYYGLYNAFKNSTGTGVYMDIKDIKFPNDVVHSCYDSLFYNCRLSSSSVDLTSMILPATTLAEDCYNDMFYNCTALTATPTLMAPSPNATGCYAYMFQGCTSLNKVTTYATSWNTNNTARWLQSVAATGDFYNLGGATIPQGDNGIPYDWTEHTSL